jgi:fluoride exporter
MNVTAVIVGSALGGMARFWLADLVGRRLGERFPWGILVVNGSGAFAMGILAALTPAGASEGGSLAWHLAGLGFLGSYTTVSSFSLQTLALAHAGAWRRAAANVAGSLGLCLCAVSIGLFAGAWLAGAPA